MEGQGDGHYDPTVNRSVQQYDRLKTEKFKKHELHHISIFEDQ